MYLELWWEKAEQLHASADSLQFSEEAKPKITYLSKTDLWVRTARRAYLQSVSIALMFDTFQHKRNSSCRSSIVAVTSENYHQVPVFCEWWVVDDFDIIWLNKITYDRSGVLDEKVSKNLRRVSMLKDKHEMLWFSFYRI